MTSSLRSPDASPRFKTQTLVIGASALLAGLVGGFVLMNGSSAPAEAQALVVKDAAVRACADRSEASLVLCAGGFADSDTNMTVEDAVTLSTTVDGVTYRFVSMTKETDEGRRIVGSPQATCAPASKGACRRDGSWSFDPASSASASEQEDARRVINRAIAFPGRMVEELQARFVEIDLSSDPYGGLDVDGLTREQLDYVEAYVEVDSYL